MIEPICSCCGWHGTIRDPLERIEGGWICWDLGRCAARQRVREGGWQ